MSSLAELKEKYDLEGGKYEPNPMCKFCKGSGEKSLKKGGLTFCICLYISHEASDEVGDMLGKVAKQMRESMKAVIAFLLITSTADAQSIVTSGGNRSIVTSSAAAVVLPKPKPTGPTESDLLRMEIDFLKSSLAAATAPNPAPVPVVAVPLIVKPQTGNYIVAFTASWCGPCRTWKLVELPKLLAAGVAVRTVDVDEEPQWKISSLPTFWVVDRKTRRALRKFTGSTSATVLQANISTAVSTPLPVAKPVQLRSRLPVVRTRWGTIDLETYHKNCNCEMCQGIRALQRQYRQQYNPTSMPTPPAEADLDFADIGQDATPDDLIDQAVTATNLRPNDVLADPGCGDGRVLIAYVKKSGCRGIGVEIDPVKADEARANIAEANLADQISVITGDVLDFDPSAHGVTAIFVHLYDDLLEKLAPKFRQPGIRVVVTPYHQVPGLPMQQHGDVWVYRPTAIRSSSGLFGHIGTSHESRETLVNHLLTEGEHRGRHSARDLARMSDEQLDALHSRDHALLN